MTDQHIEKSSDHWSRVVNWVDERYHVRGLMHTLLYVYIPRDAKTYYLGGITLFLFLIQGITGSLLSLYYQPTPNTAYDSVLFIMGNVNFGWLVRSIHSWSANLMIIFSILHLLRIYFQGVYKPPRELTWGIGVVLLTITLGFGFTGYLLPWDQRAFWATTVGSESFGAVPLVGEYLLQLLRGGADVTGATLSRFYGIHTLILPISLGLFLVVHLVLIHQQGMANPRKAVKQRSSTQEVQEPEEGEKEATLPFFPHYIISEVIAWYIILAIIIILASLFPVGLEEQANPIVTPAHVKPEWYFLSLYQLLKYVPRTVGVLAPMVGLLLLISLPFIDRNPQIRPLKRPLAIFLGLLVLTAVIGLTIWGWVS